MSASDLTPPAAAYSWATIAGELLPHHGLDLGHDLRPRLGHRRDPLRHLGLLLGLEQREHLGGQRRVQVGDDEGDGLRRLVAQEDVDLLGRRAAQELERPALDRRGQAADDLLGAVGAERALEDGARVVDAALGDVVLGEHRVDGLADDLAADLVRDLARLGDLERERLDLSVAEVAEDLAGALLADGDEQDGGLLDAPEALGAGGLGAWTGGEFGAHFLVLGHPLLDLGGDALGLALHQLVDRLQVGVRRARRELIVGCCGPFMTCVCCSS